MWIFAQRGFLSIVAHEDDASALHVRARFAGDIERFFPRATVEVTPGCDYLYRASIDREAMAKVLADQVRQIGYRNFKGSIAEPRHSWYFEVWLVMVQAQLALSPVTTQQAKKWLRRKMGGK